MICHVFSVKAKQSECGQAPSSSCPVQPSFTPSSCSSSHSPTPPVLFIVCQGNRIVMSKSDVEKDSSTVLETPTDSTTTSLYDESKDEVTFPEGGRDAWLALLGAALVQFTTFGYINAFGVYQDYYVREYLTNHSPSDIGWIGGAQICLTYFMGIITGRLFDAGYFHHLMICGTIIYALSFFTLSLSHEGQYYQVFLSQGLGGGLASGITYIPCLGVVAHYFHRHRPLAMGAVQAGTAIGAVIHPIMLNKLFHGNIGFHNGVRISAALNTSLLIIANLIMRSRLPPKKGRALPFLEFLRDPPYFFQVLGGVCLICGVFFPAFYMQLEAITHGVDRQFAFYCLSILNAASFFGRTIPNALVPKLGVFNSMIFYTIGMGALIFSMEAVQSAAAVTIYAILVGFFSGAAISLNPALLASLAKDHSEIGARIGISFAFTGLMGLFATPISGALLTTHFEWMRAVIYAGVTMFVSTFFFSITRFLLVKRRGTQFV